GFTAAGLAYKAAKWAAKGGGAEFAAARLATLKAASEKLDAALTQHADALVQGTKLARAALPALWTDEEFRQKQKAAQQAVANPEAMVDNVHKGVGSMSGVAPYTFGAFSTLAGDHTQLIADTLRSPQVEGFLPQPWVTSATERQLAQQQVLAIENP